VQRDASFVPPVEVPSPGSVAGEALVVGDPSVRLSDSEFPTPRHVTLFFTNRTGTAVKPESTDVTADGPVTAKVEADDCAKLPIFGAGDRCSVDLTVSPNRPGEWSVDVKLFHSGPGRLAHAIASSKFTGNGKGALGNSGAGFATSLAGGGESIDFGSVVASKARASRTVEVANSTAGPLLFASPRLVAQTEDVSIRPENCAIGQEIQPGGRCLLSLVWEPHDIGALSTDLLIGEKDKVLVVPVRGTAVQEGSSGVAVAGQAPPLPLPGGRSSALQIPDVLDPLNSGKGGGGLAGSSPNHSSGIRLVGIAGDEVIFQDGGSPVLGRLHDPISLSGRSYTVEEVQQGAVVLLTDGRRQSFALVGGDPSPKKSGGAKQERPTIDQKTMFGSKDNKKS